MDALVGIVGSETRARVLTALFAQPPREYYQRELARLVRLPLQAVQRELARLGDAGLLQIHEVGGRRLYSADPRSAVCSDLQAITLKLRGAGATLAEALRLEKGIALAWVFGSYATGTAQAASDVDVMVIGRVRADRVSARMRSVERRLDRTVNEHIVAPAEWRERLSRRDPFLLEVRRTPRIWLIGDERSLRDLEQEARR